MPICTPYFWIVFPTVPFMFCCNGRACRPEPPRPPPPPPPTPPEQLNTN